MTICVWTDEVLAIGVDRLTMTRGTLNSPVPQVLREFSCLGRGHPRYWLLSKVEPWWYLTAQATDGGVGDPDFITEPEGAVVGALSLQPGGDLVLFQQLGRVSTH